jgi:spore maturation protein CgeB
MKIALITIVYKESIRAVYNQHMQLKDSSYSDQKYRVDRDLSIWTSGWENAFKKSGWEVLSIPINVKHMQLKWGEENNFPSNDLHEIALEQLKRFKPDILWYDYFSVPLIQKIKAEVDSIKLILGWTGSAIVDFEVFKESDIVLSCAPETVQKLNNSGIKSAHLHHAFNPLLLENLSNNNNRNQKFVFIGQIFRGGEFHNKREKLLLELIRETELIIYSPAVETGVSKLMISLLKRGAYHILTPFENTEIIKTKIRTSPYIKEIFKAGKNKSVPYNNALKLRMKPPVYGGDMYQVLSESLIVLNIHADSSPEFASNMRLFETTGVGSCLLTDWKKNLNDLFEDGKEIVSYTSSGDCLEKAKWLLDNPDTALRIGNEGQKKVLKEHTYDSRINDLIKIIESCSVKL